MKSSLELGLEEKNRFCFRFVAFEVMACSLVSSWKCGAQFCERQIDKVGTSNKDFDIVCM